MKTPASPREVGSTSRRDQVLASPPRRKPSLHIFDEAIHSGSEAQPVTESIRRDACLPSGNLPTGSSRSEASVAARRQRVSGFLLGRPARQSPVKVAKASSPVAPLREGRASREGRLCFHRRMAGIAREALHFIRPASSGTTPGKIGCYAREFTCHPSLHSYNVEGRAGVRRIPLLLSFQARSIPIDAQHAIILEDESDSGAAALASQEVPEPGGVAPIGPVQPQMADLHRGQPQPDQRPRGRFDSREEHQRQVGPIPLVAANPLVIVQELAIAERINRPL